MSAFWKLFGAIVGNMFGDDEPTGYRPHSAGGAVTAGSFGVVIWIFKFMLGCAALILLCLVGLVWWVVSAAFRTRPAKR